MESYTSELECREPFMRRLQNSSLHWNRSEDELAVGAGVITVLFFFAEQTLVET